MSTTTMSPEGPQVPEFDMVQAAMVDMNGIPRGKMVSHTTYTKMVKKGTEFAGFPVGLNDEFPFRVSEIMTSSMGNQVLLPEEGTLVEVPWACRPGRRVGQVLGTLLDDHGEPFPSCPRNHTIHQLKKLQSLGYELFASLTCQFKVYKTGTDCKEHLGSSINSHLSPYGLLGAETELLDLARDLKKMGVAVESVTHGAGPGSFEIITVPADGLKLADMAVRLKMAVKSVMAARGYSATFMSQPHAPNDTTHSGWKLRFTLRTWDGQNVFTAASGDGPSDLCRSWVAGVLSHGAALTALFCPTFNCYRKFSGDGPCPRKLDWAVDSAVTSLSAHVTQDGIWLETSILSSACSPHFAIIGLVASGLEGIERNFPCPEPNSNTALEIPRSLKIALCALEADSVLTEAISPLLTKSFVSIKQDNEVAPFVALEGKDNSEVETRALENKLYFISV